VDIHRCTDNLTRISVILRILKRISKWISARTVRSGVSQAKSGYWLLAIGYKSDVFDDFSLGGTLPVQDRRQLCLPLFYTWYEPAVHCWLDLADKKVSFLCSVSRFDEL